MKRWAWANGILSSTFSDLPRFTKAVKPTTKDSEYTPVAATREVFSQAPEALACFSTSA